MSRRRTEKPPCPYSASCFVCPLSDCIGAGYRYNALPGDAEILQDLHGEAVRDRNRERDANRQATPDPA